MSIVEETPFLKTGIRVVKSERFQRFCLKCGKILPTKIKQDYTHNCEKPDFLLWKEYAPYVVEILFIE